MITFRFGVPSMSAERGCRARRFLGVGFAASLASATVAALAAPVPEGWRAGVALFGATISAAFSSLIGAYALSWRAAGVGTACGAAAAMLPQPAPDGSSLLTGCWISASVAALVVSRERPDALQKATSPGLVAVVHVLQLPLIVFSAAMSLVSAPPRPFVVLYTVSAFALWRLLAGKCPLTHAEEALRALRGETTPRGSEMGFIGRHLYRGTGILIPAGFVSALAYLGAGMAFAWYAVEAVR